MTQTKDQTNELEAHLEKYGYIRPKGKEGERFVTG